MPRTLYRSRSDRMIAGVCGGLAEYWDVDPTLVRLGAVLLAWTTSGLALLAYVVLAIVVPEEPLGATAGTWTPPPPGGAEREGTTMSAEDQGQGNQSGAPGATRTPPPPPPGQPPAYYQAPPPPPGHDHGRRGGLVGGLVLIALGLIFLASEFFPQINIGQFWPLILIAIGIGILLRARER